MAPILAALVLCAATAGASAADPVRIPGTAISLTPPEGFRIANRFAGIADESRRASVQVVELAAPIEAMQADMTEQALAPRGLQVERREPVDAALDDAMLLEVLQSADGDDWRLWILLGGDKNDTVLLTARAPEPVGADLAADLEGVLLAATRQADAEIDPLEALTFTLTPSGGLDIATSMMGSSLLLTLDGQESDMDPGEPFMIVAQSMRDEAVDDLMEFAEQRLSLTEGATDVEVRERRTLEVDGMTAIELIGDAIGQNDLESTIYQLLLQDEGGYLLAQGHVATGGHEAWLPVFRSIGESIRSRD